MKTRNGQIINMRLFNEQMAPLFEVLERIVETMSNEHLTTTKHDIEVTIEKDDDKYVSNAVIYDNNVALKSLPE
ncbi:unnamed protein product [Rotaria sp. Silwood2]|nr:unnamed protein product [Rotaria sp. Silwood2]CAF2492220.1 unnamed protein product [Rotaria sp. Silwood2]CAF2874907.1 unnamed protein product [Rotaria sp. Silwood2]CAF3884256.1 unnamed protein product [Rotaria sp. Silwood2]CAF4139112.1 unnamed protein product [Rotaria sp. Silwood2]